MVAFITGSIHLIHLGISVCLFIAQIGVVNATAISPSHHMYESDSALCHATPRYLHCVYRALGYSDGSTSSKTAEERTHTQTER